MEVVQTFNREMKSLLDHRPPVSRQKMSMITKSAIRGIKFYKHIVQSVEKFIQKCSPDYKVPGLYVMDAIIRQSRHQYGAERDVFAPRFLKNLLPTFQQLFRCDEKDQHLVVRVLNLWLKNETFPPEVIQSLLSLADNPDDPNLVALAQAQVSVAITNQTTGSASLHRLKRPHHHHQHGHQQQRHRQRQSSQQQDFVDNEADDQTDVAMETMPGDENDVDYIGDNSNDAGLTMTDSASSTASAAAAAAMPQGGIISSVAELLQKFQDTDDVRDQINQLQSLQDKILQQSSLLSQQQMIDPDILGQLQALMEELTKTARAAVEREQEAQRAKDVVAFDYGDESDDEANIGSNGLQKRQPVGILMPSTAAGGGGGGGGVDQNFLDQLQQMTETLAQTRVLQEQLQSARKRQQLEEAEQQQQQQLHHLQEGQYYQIQQHQLLQQQQQPQQQQQQHHHVSYEEGEIDDETKATGSASKPSISNYNNNNNTAVGESGGDQYSRGGKRDTGHGHGHGHSHGHSSRHPRSPTSAAAAAATASQSTSSSSRRRRRSHSGGRGESSERRRKERKRKALPRLRDGQLSIVSATIFIGKLQKSTTEGRLRSLLDEYGQVQALVLIPSRGCGFVVYSKRKHAAKAIDKLRSTRLEGATLRVAWAPNKGIKDTEMKEFWDEEEGCTYIPYDRFPRDESWRDLLQGGAFIDQDSVPLELVDLVRQTTPRDQDVGDVDQRVRDPAAHAEAVAGMPPPPSAISGSASSVALNLPPPPPPQLAHHMLMMQPPPMPMQMPHFPAFMPPPPPPPPSSSTNVASTSSPPAQGDSAAAAVSLGSKPPPLQQPHPRTTLLPMPPPHPHQPQHQHVRTPIPPHRPPHVGFFRGGGIGSGILPPPPFNPRGGGGGIGAWRGGGGIGRGL